MPVWAFAITDYDRMEGMRPGYSSVGGQTQSPYIAGGLISSEPVMGHSVRPADRLMLLD